MMIMDYLNGPPAACGLYIVRWFVSYETATVRQGVAPTRAEAERAANVAHDTLVIAGLNPDKLAWHVG